MKTKREKDDPRQVLYQLTPKGEREALRAFAMLGYSESEARDPHAMPGWLKDMMSTKDSNDMGDRPGWIVFQSFTAGDRHHCRGDFLEHEEGLRLRQEIRDSYLKATLIPIGWKPKVRTVPTPAKVSIDFGPIPEYAVEIAGRVKPADALHELAVLILRQLDRGRSFSQAIDLVDHDALMRASKQWADWPKTLSSGLRTGVGTPHRSVAGFNDVLSLVVRRLRGNGHKQAA
jgi:hypothetical protein